MDQIKIGKFIAERRKLNHLTQIQLAEKLNITDKAVSKWENGKSMPDSSIMLALCKELKITVNDLLNGEVVSMDNYNKTLEENLMEVMKQKEASDKMLLATELAMGIACILPIVTAVLITLFVPMEEKYATIIALASIIPLLVATPFALKIEQTAGYYECAKCGHKYVPNYKSVFLTMHIGITRYMRCPKCHKKSWQKKILCKEQIV